RRKLIVVYLINLLINFLAARELDSAYQKGGLFNVNSRLLLLVVCFSILPALQFGVGSDYFHYSRIYESYYELEFYKVKQEYFFYYIATGLKSLGLGPQWLFIACSLLISVLFCNAVRLLIRNGFNASLFVLLIILVSGIYHNQMNVIRTYLAVMFFINAFLYRYEQGSRIYIVLFFAAAAFISHRTVFIALPILLIPAVFHRFVVSNAILFSIVLFFVYLSGL